MEHESTPGGQPLIASVLHRVLPAAMAVHHLEGLPPAMGKLLPQQPATTFHLNQASPAIDRPEQAALV
jgi:hypothetical protein